MKTFLALIVVCLVPTASGCSFVQSDYDQYANTMAAHSTAEQVRISAQSQAIADTVMTARTSTQTESTLLAVIGMMQIERLQPVPLGMTKPTTWADVGNTAVGHIPFVAATGFMYRLGKIGIENAGQIAIGDGSTVTDSLNRPEIHATGSDNGVQYSGTAPAAEPVIVQPSYPPEVKP